MANHTSILPLLDKLDREGNKIVEIISTLRSRLTTQISQAKSKANTDAATYCANKPLSDAELNGREAAIQKSMGEITVLEYPEVYWNTVFIDGKFYIAHPL